MKYIGTERESEALEWAEKVLGLDGPKGFARALSAVDSEGNFCLVIVYSNFTETNVDIHTAAAPGARWATPRAGVEMFRAAFSFAFEHMGVERVTGLVRSDNTAARRFDEHLGFKLEGVMRRAFKDADLCIYGFLKDEFYSHPWYKGKQK